MTALQYKYQSAIIREERAAQSAALKTVFAKFINMIMLYQDRAHARRQLASMSPKMLADIGVSHAQAMAEAEKPFWKA